MITPLDIQNKQFAKGVRGYKEEEVDQFLDMLTLDFEKVIEENRQNKDKIVVLEKEIQKFKTSEHTVIDTLETAKALMRDISASAEKRAEILLKNAELDGQLIIKESKENVEKLNEEYRALKARVDIFKTRYKSLLESEMEKFDTLSQELFYPERSFSVSEEREGQIDIEAKLKSLEDL